MTTYITHLDELKKLAKGEIKVEDIAKPENIAVLTWSGSDLKTMLEAKAENHIEIDEGIVNDIINRLDGLGCGDCVSYAVADYIREGEC